MKKYCRYCANAIDYNGEAEDFVCTADAPCGNNGAGRMYPAKRAKRINHCKYFEFNSLDVFYTTYGEHHYKPKMFSPGGSGEGMYGIIKESELSKEDIEDLKQQVMDFMKYAEEKDADRKRNDRVIRKASEEKARRT